MKIIEAAVWKLIQMSICGSFMIVAVIAIRMVFRKLPKKYLCILWMLAFLRLICPFNIVSLFSILPVSQQQVTYINEAMNVPQITTGMEGLDDTFNHSMIQYHAVVQNTTAADDTKSWVVMIITSIWFIGFLILVGYEFICTLYLKQRLSTAIREENNIYRTDKIKGAFLMAFYHRESICHWD